jgi:hypothetical protein
MPQADRTNLNEVDETFAPIPVTTGISGVIGKFKGGPINSAGTLVTSYAGFQKIFGGLQDNQDDAFLVKRCLERGSALRIVNVGHYTDITDASTLVAVKATPANVKTVALNGVLVTGNTITVTINSTPVAQLFTTNSDNTLKLLVTKIIQQVPAVVNRAAFMGSNTILLTPQTGITLTVTAAVTGGASQATATVGTVTTINDGAGHTLATLTMKYYGPFYNDVEVQILPASNGSSSYFDLWINFLSDETRTEKYTNLIIGANTTAANATFLQDIINKSQLINVTYSDLSALSGQLRPVNTYLKYDGGSDGGAIVDTDLIGDASTKTGLFAFDGYDDMFQIAHIGINADEHAAVAQAGQAYVESRQDLCYFLHIDNANITESEVTAAKDALLLDSTYVAIFCGGVIVLDPRTGLNKSISELGDVLGTAAYSQAQFGPWWSFAGRSRGTILNALGVVNNFGLDSNLTGRQLLASHQICMIANNKGKMYVRGNFTGQLANSQRSYLNVRMMLIYLKKALLPLVENYIEEPNDPISWKSMYQSVAPTLKNLVTKRAIYDWDWQGDQFITDVSKCVINDPNQVGQGVYKAKLFVKAIVSMQQIQVDITLTDSGVSFEDNLNTVISNPQ